LLHLDRPGPMVTALMTREPVLFGDPDELAARFPRIHDDMLPLGDRSFAAMPMVREDGVPFGALGISWTDPQRFDDTLLSTLRTMTDLCASSLTRAWLTDQTAASTAALATLARHLSVARSSDEVATAI